MLSAIKQENLIDLRNFFKQKLYIYDVCKRHAKLSVGFSFYQVLRKVSENEGVHFFHKAMVSGFYVVLVNMRYDKFLQKFSDEGNLDCAMESHAEKAFFSANYWVV